MSRRDEPQGLQELTNRLAARFQRPGTSTLNPSRYLTTSCFDQSNKFRDGLASFQSNQFTFSNFGDELLPKELENTAVGQKRSGTELDGPTPKKRKLNETEYDSDDIDSDDDDDDDVDMESKNKKKGEKREKKRPPPKYRVPEVEDLEPPPIEPSRASEFFDPIKACKINLDQESKMNDEMKQFMRNSEILSNDDIDVSPEEVKYFQLHKLKKMIQEKAKLNKMSVQNQVPVMFALSLQDYLKNMFDEMEKWRQKRKNCNKHNNRIQFNAVNIENWINDLNEKYSAKQQIVDAKDELEALETEQTELTFKRMVAVLTDEEKNRHKKLENLIKIAKDKQKRSNEQVNNANMHDSSLAAVGGNFDFRFKSKNKRNKGRTYLEDKFYAVDVINMMEHSHKHKQNHLKQLTRLYLKQT